MGVKKGGKLRRWSDEEKRSICSQTLAPGVSVAQVARRYSMNANLIFKWLKDPRFTPCVSDPGDAGGGGAGFLPVAISSGGASLPAGGQDSTGVSSVTRVDLTLSDGRRILIEGPTSLAGVLRLVEGLLA